MRTLRLVQSLCKKKIHLYLIYVNEQSENVNLLIKINKSMDWFTKRSEPNDNTNLLSMFCTLYSKIVSVLLFVKSLKGVSVLPSWYQNFITNMML